MLEAQIRLHLIRGLSPLTRLRYPGRLFCVLSGHKNVLSFSIIQLKFFHIYQIVLITLVDNLRQLQNIFGLFLLATPYSRWVLYLINLLLFLMATNSKAGDNRRYGAVKGRSQVFNSQCQNWVKRDIITGKFMDVKLDGTPFKGIRRENK